MVDYLIIPLRQHKRTNLRVSSEIYHSFYILDQVHIGINILCNNGLKEGEGGLVGSNFH